MRRYSAAPRLSFCLVALFSSAPVKADMFPTNHLNGLASVNSWKALRDFQVVKQEMDYSCGAASLATILNEFYGMSVTEEDVLTRMGATDRSSFQQLAEVAPSYGVKAGGIMLSFDDLKQLQVPAIAYIQYRGDDHFTVIRGIHPRWRGAPGRSLMGQSPADRTSVPQDVGSAGYGRYDARTHPSDSSAGCEHGRS